MDYAKQDERWQWVKFLSVLTGLIVFGLVAWKLGMPHDLWDVAGIVVAGGFAGALAGAIGGFLVAMFVDGMKQQ